MKKKLFLTAVFAALLASGIVSAAAATEYEWSMDLDCTLCHQKEVVSLESGEEAAAEKEVDAKEAPASKDTTNNKDTEDEPAAGKATDQEPARPSVGETTEDSGIADYAAMHVATFGFECATCHVESEGLEAGHKKLNSGKEAKRLRKSEVDASFCTDCHQIEELAEATATYTGLTDANGTCVNPHDLPAGESHESVLCTDCHQVHSEKTLNETAVTTCNGCHHAGVFECGTCH